MAQDGYNQLGRTLATSIGGFFGGNGQAQQAGQMAGLQQAQLQGNIDLQQLTAAAQRAKMAEAESKQQLASPEASLSRVLVRNGIPTDQVSRIAEFFATGRDASSEPVEVGPATQAPNWLADRGIKSAIAQQFADARSLQGGDAESLNDIASARSKNLQTGVQSGIADGSVDPRTGGTRLYAMGGGKAYDFNEYGVGDNYGGGVDTANPAAARFGDKRLAETAAQKANAVQSYASANASNASAAKSRQDREQGARSGDNQIVTDANGNVTIVNKSTGLARPAVGLDGKPVGARAAGGGNASEDERKAAGWVSQAQFAYGNIEKAIAEDPSAANPGVVQSLVGAVPVVGQAMKNSITSDARQRFEQAASSFSEAALRAATGAGVNRDEAEQKIREVTPVYGDKTGTIEQKKQALTMYLDSLRARAGRALPVSAGPAEARSPAARTVVRTGTANGRKVVQYSDGTTDYAD